MAYFYSLSIECGQDRAAALVCAKHFEGWNLPSEASLADSRIDVSVSESTADNTFWVVVIPYGVSRSGAWSLDTAHAMTLVGRYLLDRLKSAPPFRFAIVGIEAYEALQFDDIGIDLVQDPTFPTRFDGLVISREVYERLGRSDVFSPFGPNTFHIPYQGETFSGQ